jgi:hypothetical protein
VAVVISLNNFLGPVDDTVTAQKCSTSTSTRTEDVWQRYNQFRNVSELSIRVSPSHSYNAGGPEGMCAMHAVIVLWLWCWGTSLMIQPQVPEYSRPFQLSLFRNVSVWYILRYGLEVLG